MSVEIVTLLIWGALLVLMMTGFSIAFSLLAVSVMGYIAFVGPSALPNLYSVIYRTITLDIFIAVPLFLFMAVVLQVSGVGERLYDTMHKWMGGIRGGLAIGTVLICTIIAAATGLGGTGTVMMGLLAYPEMMKRGYDKKMCLGCIPAGGALGPLIPPSVPAILIGGLGGLSTGKLFMAGVIPGLLCSLFFCLYIAVICFLNPKLGPPIPAEERVGWKEKFIALKGITGAMLLIVLVLGGIYSGAFTPSEAGGIGAVGALLVAIINRSLTFKKLKEAVITTLNVNAMVMWIVIGGATFSSVCGITGITHFMSNLLGGLPLGRYGILLVMMLILFVEGMFIDGTAIIMISLPIMLPVAIQLEFDPLWFAFLFNMNVIIGMITPPFGYNLFYMKGLKLKDVSMMDIYIGVLPYIPLMVLALVLCIAFPQLALWIPNMMVK
ncbi:MAG: TRAP transporter large permease subunit [Deltaproteobacteria bacterium]|nr:TRAP transporter large permease subunit [Deltaproteobacteria bacterium]